MGVGVGWDDPTSSVMIFTARMMKSTTSRIMCVMRRALTKGLVFILSAIAAV